MGIGSSKPRAKEIDNQIKDNICKISISEKYIGTGFLCKIPYPDEFKYLRVLIANYHLFTQKDLLENKTINISFNNDKVTKSIKITPERKIYKSEKYDVNIIEILDGDDIHKFLDFNAQDIDLNKKEIYIPQYSEKNIAEVFYGKIKKVQDFEIKHNAKIKETWDEGPIMLLDNLEVIGIHRGKYRKKNYYFGTLLKYPIKEMYEEFINVGQEKEIMEIEKDFFVKDKDHKDKIDYISTISVILRECGKANPIIITCSLNDKIIDIIKNNVKNYNSCSYRYNGNDITDLELTLEELGVLNKHTIFVIRIRN